MATQHLRLADDAPVDLVAALNLARGESYICENQGPRTVSLFEGAAAPADGVGHHVHAPDPRNPAAAGSSWTVTAPAAGGLWAWSADARVVVTES